MSEFLRAGQMAAMGDRSGRAVFGLTSSGKIGECAGDNVLPSALIPNIDDSALDITFGTFGGMVGRRRRGPAVASRSRIALRP